MAVLKYRQGRELSPPNNRATGKQAQEVVDQVRLAGLKVEGSAALAAHIMEVHVELNARRLDLAGGDIGLDALLMDIQLNAVRQAKSIQNGIYGGFTFGNL